MDASRLLLLVAVVISTSHWKSEAMVSCCGDFDKQTFRLLEGEAFHFVPYNMTNPNRQGEEFTWYKSSPEFRNISSNETETVHYHGGALLFLHLLPADAGHYICQEIRPTGKCYNHHVTIAVFNTSYRADKKLTYGAVKDSDDNKDISCPSPVSDTCRALKGNFTWYKDFHPLPGEHGANMWVENATKDDEGIYTCICTWRHNHKVYNSSASRRLIVQEKVTFDDVQILSPTDKVQLADKGRAIKLNCSVYCGKSATLECSASWNINGNPVIFINSNRYNQTTKIVTENPSKKTIATAILTIDKVSAKDFEDEFECVGTGLFSGDSRTLTLKQRVFSQAVATASNVRKSTGFG